MPPAGGDEVASVIVAPEDDLMNGRMLKNVPCDAFEAKVKTRKKPVFKIKYNSVACAKKSRDVLFSRVPTVLSAEEHCTT